jgi:hypothetical protein
LRLGAIAPRAVGTPVRGENSAASSNKIDSRKRDLIEGTAAMDSPKRDAREARPRRIHDGRTVAPYNRSKVQTQPDGMLDLPPYD